MDPQTLKAAFYDAFSDWLDTTPKDSTKLLAFCRDNGTFVVDDLPYPLDKTGFADHCTFHEGDLWDARCFSIISLETHIHETQGNPAGLVHGTYNLRGKPRNAGFRQRPGHFSAVCTWDADGNRWTALNVHFSPLLSQVLDASPS
jgi:hypothetical protein